MSFSRAKRRQVFTVFWWNVNLLLLVSFLALLYSAAWEYSVRCYLQGFSDAIVPVSAAPEQKTEAILAWMRSGPARPIAAHLEQLDKRDPETTLNYQQLLSVCGTATNAFLNLARSSGLQARRLLLLTPENTTKHVVAEVLMDDRWVVVDPTYRWIMHDSQGRLLSRDDLQDKAELRQATAPLPEYRPIYTYDHVAHVRLARLPFQGFGLGSLLDAVFPGWDELLDWSLLLERESFFVLTASFFCALFFFFFRAVLAWYADHRLIAPRFHLREHLLRATATFFSAPETKN